MRKGFIPFITAGDPDVETSLAIMHKLAKLGADIIELGVPFSDPMADGPTIQRSSARALANGVTVDVVLDMVRRFRIDSDVPVVLFSYFNPIYIFGVDTFVTAAAGAGVDGVLITDVSGDEADAIADRLAASDIDLIRLIAPTTIDERLQQISRTGRGFIYALARAGVTGARREMTGDAEALVLRARRFTDLPIAVGFGISTPAQIVKVHEFADAAVVGSAIVSEIERASSHEDAVNRADAFVRTLLSKVAISGRKTVEL